MAVKASVGIGMGLVVHGRVLRGAWGAAGELGHLPVTPPGRATPPQRCECGNRGCLQTIAGVHRVAAEVRRAKRLPQLPSVEDVVALARRRDPAIVRVLDEAGEALGTALACVVTLVNPHAVVISGPLAPAGPLLLDPVQRAMTRGAHPATGHRTVLTMSQLGPGAEARGAAAMAALGAVVPA